MPLQAVCDILALKAEIEGTNKFSLNVINSLYKTPLGKYT